MADGLFDIEGFDALNAKLKRLPDTVKRNEILKIFRRLAKPVVTAYRSTLPIGSKPHSRYTKGGGKTTYQPGNLSRSVRAATVSRSKSKGKPIVQVLPDKRGQSDGYYRFMVVKKGFKGSGRGSRKNANTVVGEARDKAYAATGGMATKQARDAVALYVQKQINRLSQ